MSLTKLDASIAALSPARDYQMNEPSDTLCEDFGSDGQDLTHFNSPTVGVAGPIDDMLAVTYDGANDITNNTNGATGALTMADDQTLLLIFKSTSATNPSAFQGIAAGQEDTANRWGIYVPDDSSGHVRVSHEFADDMLSWAFTTDLYDAGWHFITVSFDHSGATALGYVDGVSVGSAGALLQTANAGFFIGGRAASTFAFPGSVARIAWFNSAFAASTHESLYADYIYTKTRGMRNRHVRGVHHRGLVRF